MKDRERDGFMGFNSLDFKKIVVTEDALPEDDFLELYNNRSAKGGGHADHPA